MSSKRQRESDAEERLDRVFAALSNQTRRALLRQLERRPSKVGDLAEPFEMSLPAVSKHLRVLENAGLIRREIDGRIHHCHFDPAPLREADQWLAHYRAFWTSTLDALDDYARKKR